LTVTVILVTPRRLTGRFWKGAVSSKDTLTAGRPGVAIFRVSGRACARHLPPGSPESRPILSMFSRPANTISMRP